MACNTCPDRGEQIVTSSRSNSVYQAEQRKQYLDKVGPMVGCFEVYEDFYGYASGVYKHVTGKDVGGHCVEIIGYDDSKSCWLCKNSWGTGWGDGGFFEIGYGECGIDSDTEILGIVISGSPFWGCGGMRMAPGYTFRHFIGHYETQTADVLRYEPATYEWRCARSQGTSLTFTDAGNTRGFGQLADGRPMWTGAFQTAAGPEHDRLAASQGWSAGRHSD